MMADLSPLRLLLVTLAGWVNRHQQEVIEYLAEENHVLREQLKGRRVRLTDDQRRRLAAKGQPLGRRILRQVATIVTPDTILRWHRSRRDSLSRPLGRPVALLLSGGVTVGRVFGQYAAKVWRGPPASPRRLTLHAARAPALDEVALDGHEEGHGGHRDHDTGCHNHAPVHDGGVEQVVDAHRERFQLLGG